MPCRHTKTGEVVSSFFCFDFSFSPLQCVFWKPCLVPCIRVLRLLSGHPPAPPTVPDIPVFIIVFFHLFSGLGWACFFFQYEKTRLPLVGPLLVVPSRYVQSPIMTRPSVMLSFSTFPVFSSLFLSNRHLGPVGRLLHCVLSCYFVLPTASRPPSLIVLSLRWPVLPLFLYQTDPQVTPYIPDRPLSGQPPDRISPGLPSSP